MKIHCNLQEKQIFSLIVDHAKSLGIHITPRVAGGWVRDKIMGCTTNDIDIVLDNISGYNFAKGLEQKVSGKVGLVKENPDKSKHLETAIMKVNGMLIDFVNLRHERYTTTRIPIICDGSPEQDSLRRDLTINSLFYNLLNGKVEDFTKMGIQDITNRILRTPIDPSITLFDDPLRIIRILRFFSKLLFRIDEKIYEAMKIEKIKYALTTKVSKERIQAEIFKMCRYVNGHVGMLEIIKTGYAGIIFKPNVPVAFSYEKARKFYMVLEELLLKHNTEHDKFMLNLYVVLHNFIGLKQAYKKKMEFVNVIILKESLLASREITSIVTHLETNFQLLQEFDMSVDRIRLIRLIRQLGKYWFESLAINHSLYEKKSELIDYIIANNYERIYLTKPLVSGDFISRLLVVPKCKIKLFLDEGLVFQIANKNSTKEEIIEYLKSIKTNLLN